MGTKRWLYYHEDQKTLQNCEKISEKLFIKLSLNLELTQKPFKL